MTSEFRGLAVDFSGANPTIYATANGKDLVTFNDVGGVMSSFAVIASAGTNDGFRGVAFLTPVPEPMAVLSLSALGLFGVRLARRGLRQPGTVCPS